MNSHKVKNRFRRILLLMLAFCMALEVGAPVMAKKNTGKAEIFYTDTTKSDEWQCGTWENGCYISRTGKVKASFKKSDKAKLPKLKGLANKRILFIGASRTKRVSKAVKDNAVFFYGCGGATFRWFFQKRRKRKPAYLIIRAFIKAHPHGIVIIDMGGNDTHNIKAYIGFYRELIEKYPDVTFFFRGILPREVGDKTNANRLAFNEELEKWFPGHVINLFEKVYRMRGFRTVDGIHYPKRLNRKIYEMTMEKIGRDIHVDLSTGRVTKKKPKKNTSKKNTKKKATTKKK